MNALNEEAVGLAGEDKHEEALEKYTKAIAGSEDDSPILPVFLANRAHSLIGLGKLDEAIADCSRAQVLEPKCVMAWVTHAKAYAYRGKLGQALDLLR
jgi:tetratricopeptide (TPR) repeat protein